MDKDIKNYTRENTSLTKEGAFLVLEVPGLAEKRPSVLKGDSILVYCPQANTTSSSITKYKGYVHKVERDRVMLKFDRNYQSRYIVGQKVTVEFSYNRMSLCVCHQGIDQASVELLSYLINTEAAVVPVVEEILSSALEPITIYPIDKRLNKLQLLAVKSIVHHSNSAYHCPYLIYGPPGTGTEHILLCSMLLLYCYIILF